MNTRVYNCKDVYNSAATPLVCNNKLCNQNCNYCECCERCGNKSFFIDDSYDIIVNICAYSAVFDISKTVISSFFIKSYGCCELKASLQNSPDGENFVQPFEEITINPYETKYICTAIFSHYVRITFKSEKLCRAQLWFQAQLK